MQTFGHESLKDACYALEEEFDDILVENLDGQTVITFEEVKRTWLGYNDFADFTWEDDGDFDIDISSFKNSIWGHFLSQFPTINV